jgi:hypothetical protein
MNGSPQEYAQMISSTYGIPLATVTAAMARAEEVSNEMQRLAEKMLQPETFDPVQNTAAALLVDLLINTYEQRTQNMQLVLLLVARSMEMNDVG